MQALLARRFMTTAIDDSSRLKHSTLLTLSLILILIWGSAYTMVGVGVDHITPIWLVTYRLVLGAVLVTIYAYRKGLKFPKLADIRWRWYFVLGMTGSVIPFFLLATGQLNVDSGITAIIVGVMPLMTIVLAHFFTNERLNAKKLLGFVIGFLGIVVLFLPDNFSLELVSNWKGQLLIVIAAFCYAITTIIAKRAPETPSSIGAAMMLICSVPVAVIAGVMTGIPTQMPSMIGIWMAIGLGVGSTAIATILYLHVIQETGPSTIAKINYFVPLASVVCGVWLLGEAFTWRMVISFAVIVLGVMISRRGEGKK